MNRQFEHSRVYRQWQLNRASSHTGSALVETVVLCIVMIPLLSAIPMLGKIADLKQTTIQASRYSAWEQTVTTNGAAPTDIKARFFEDPAVQLVSGQTEVGPEQAVNPIWGSSSSESQQSYQTTRLIGSSPNVLDQSQIVISFDEGGGHTLRRNSSDSGVVKTFGRGIKESGRVLDFMGNVRWDIEADGMIDAGIQVNLVANHYLSKALAGRQGKSCAGSSHAMFSCIGSSSTIMVDGWDSATNAQAEERSRAFVPGAALEKVGRYVSNLGKIPVFKELGNLDGAFGYLDSTQLPPDRTIGTYQEAR